MVILRQGNGLGHKAAGLTDHCRCCHRQHAGLLPKTLQKPQEAETCRVCVGAVNQMCRFLGIRRQGLHRPHDFVTISLTVGGYLRCACAKMALSGKKVERIRHSARLYSIEVMQAQRPASERRENHAQNPLSAHGVDGAFSAAAPLLRSCSHARAADRLLRIQLPA